MSVTPAGLPPSISMVAPINGSLLLASTTVPLISWPAICKLISSSMHTATNPLFIVFIRNTELIFTLQKYGYDVAFSFPLYDDNDTTM